jgi:protein SCO1
MRRFRFIIWGAAAVFATLFAILYFVGNGGVQNVATAAEIGGPFRLASSKGGLVDSKDLSGKPYAVFFGYTHCPEVCPVTLSNMSSVLSDLGDKAKDFRLFFITVDPERDTVPVMKDYLANFNPRIEALVPSPEELSAVSREFHVIYQKQASSDGDYTMDHSTTVYLIGRNGKLTSTFCYGENTESLNAKLKRLIAGDPS